MKMVNPESREWDIMQVPAHPMMLIMMKMQVTATMMITNNWSHTDSLARVRFFRRSSSSAGTSSLLNLTI